MYLMIYHSKKLALLAECVDTVHSGCKILFPDSSEWTVYQDHAGRWEVFDNDGIVAKRVYDIKLLINSKLRDLNHV